MSRHRPLAAVSLVAMIALVVVADEPPRLGKKSTDADFAVRAARIHLTQNAIAQQIVSRAKDADLRQLGRILAQGHTQAYQRLQTDVLKLGFKLSDKLDVNDQQDIDRLAGEKGRFDAIALKRVIDAHGAAILLFEEETRKGSDPDMKTFASDMLPMLRKNHDSASNLWSKRFVNESK